MQDTAARPESDPHGVEDDSRGARPISPGDGERRAQRGFVPQYRMAAGLIYDHLAAGRLNWVGVAHRGAGAFDDIVLGLSDGIVGVQVKTSQTPEPFQIGARLLGAEGLWAKIVEGLARLASLEDHHRAAVIYACDDRPSRNDRLGETGPSTSADLLELHRRNGASWSWADWETTPFVAFLRKLQHAAGLDDDGFLAAWGAVTFITDGDGRLPSLAERTPQDVTRIEALAALLPRLAADPANQDRWDAADILKRLRWDDAFRPRHNHHFPITELYEENEAGLEHISSALRRTRQGYLALVGPPGSGKSTLLAAGLLGADTVKAVRYLAFIPGGRTLGREEAYDFLHDVIADLKSQDLGSTIWPGQNLPELREQFQTLLAEAGRRYTATGVRTLLIVDGLDHIPREKTPERSLLSELPQPDAVPEGVVILLGTQRLDLDDLPLSVQLQAGEPDRCIPVPALTRENVVRMAAAAGLPADVDRDGLYDNTGGHPLSTQYVIERLVREPDEASRAAWLASAPAYAGDIDRYYTSAWSSLKAFPEARKTLGFLALADGSLRQTALDGLVGRDSVDQTWSAAHHLLNVDDDGGVSVFHNSFRLFLQAKTTQRLGRPDPALTADRLRELAGMARAAEPDDPQRWMELRYVARAGDDDRVLDLATPDRFREHFIEGRGPAEIQDDISLAFKAAGRKRRADRLLPLLLSRQEIELRAESISDGVVDAWLALGDRRAARSLLDAGDHGLSEDAAYRLIDADLAAGDIVAAKSSFQAVEPLDLLMGVKPVSGTMGDDGLEEWAERSLAFRPTQQVLKMLGRLSAAQDIWRPVDLDDLRWRLRLAALRGELRRRPELDPDTLRRTLGLPETDRATAQLYGALASYAGKRPAEAVARIAAALEDAHDLEDHERLTVARLAGLLNRNDLIAKAVDGSAPPVLGDAAFRGEDAIADPVDDVIDHAAFLARLDRPAMRGGPPSKRFLAELQARLEDFGRLCGQWRTAPPAPEAAAAELKAFLSFIAHAEGEGVYDFERQRLDAAMGRIVERVIDAAVLAGEAVAGIILADLDAAGDRDWRVRQPSVRRAYALRAFRLDRDVEAARARIAYVEGAERTPEAQLEEASASAVALVALGLRDEARDLLRTMHLEGCGLFRAAKKDPQYHAWIELLDEACREDPAGREGRVIFMTRFLSGLSEAEGYDTGARVLPMVLEQAAQGRAALAIAVGDRSETLTGITWTKLIAAVGRGVARASPHLSDATAIVVGRLAAPFTTDHDGDPFRALIEAAPSDAVVATVQRMLDIIETDTADEIRLKLLEAAADAARGRGIEAGWDRLARWRTELPLPSSGSSPEDPFFHTRTLEDIETLLAAPEERVWRSTSAFVRIAPRAGYPAASAFLDRHPDHRSDRQVLRTIGELGLQAGDRAAAEHCRDALHAIAEDRASYDDGWAGGGKLLAWELDVMLRGEPARREAFDVLIADLATGWAWPSRILQYLVDILRVISPAPAWPEAWSALEAHIGVFREFALGKPLTLEPLAPGGHDDCVEVLADLLHRALALGPSTLADQVRLAGLDLAETPHGRLILARLINRLLAGEDDQPLQAMQTAWAFRRCTEVEAILRPRLAGLCGHADYGVRRLGQAMSLLWRLPSKALEEADVMYRSASANGKPEDVDRSLLARTWPVKAALAIMARTSGLELDLLRSRAARIMATLGLAPTEDGERTAAIRATRLEIYAPQPKVVVRAAFLAARRLLAELATEGAVTPSEAEAIVRHCGIDGVVDFDRHLEARPPGLARPTFGSCHREEEYEAWLGEVDKDLRGPTLPGLVVVAGWTRHRSFRRSAEQEIELAYGVVPRGEDLAAALGVLPVMQLETGIVLEQTGGRPPVIRRRFGPVFWQDDFGIGLCPQLAEGLGWRADPREPTRFLNHAGTVQVRTLQWRDSGSVGRIHGETLLREGELVVATKTAARRLGEMVDLTSTVQVWRKAQWGEPPHRRSSSASTSTGRPDPSPRKTS